MYIPDDTISRYSLLFGQSVLIPRILAYLSNHQIVHNFLTLTIDTYRSLFQPQINAIIDTGILSPKASTSCIADRNKRQEPNPYILVQNSAVHGRKPAGRTI